MNKKLLLAHWGERVRQEENTARLAAAHRFVFDCPWDFEGTDEPVFAGDPIRWDLKANGDDEFLYQLNRHRFLLSLAEAHSLTGEAFFLDSFRRLLFDWIERCPYNEQTAKTLWRSLDTAERCANWVKSFILLGSKSFLEEEKLTIDRLMQQHIQVLLDTQSDQNLVSNWGFFHDHGLFFGALYFHDLPLLGRVFAQMTQRYAHQFDPQGVHREASCSYQAAILIFHLDALLFCKREKIAVPEAIRAQTQKIAEALLFFLSPGRKLLPFGDSDTEDCRDLMTRVALLLGDGRFKTFGYPVPDHDTLLFANGEMIASYADLPRRTPETLTFFSQESGHLSSRSDESSCAHGFHWMNPPYGGGHSHSDKLHLDIYLDGQPVLTDSGRYTYRDCPERRQLKSAESHNVCTVDGLDYQTMLSSWDVASAAAVSPIAYREKEAFLFAEGAHYGYLPQNGVLCRRQLLWLKPDIFLIADLFFSSQRHDYTAYFQFAPDCRTVREGDILRCHAKGFDVLLYPFWSGSKIVIDQGLYAPRYNRLQTRDRACITLQGQSSAVGLTLLAKENRVQRPMLLIDESETKALSFSVDGRRIGFFVTGKQNCGARRCGNLVFSGQTALQIDDDIYLLKR